MHDEHECGPQGRAPAARAHLVVDLSAAARALLRLEGLALLRAVPEVDALGAVLVGADEGETMTSSLV